jgi:hypothetical protein
MIEFQPQETPMTTSVQKRNTIKKIAAFALFAGATALFGTANAQTKLKWAHVYETSEPYHTPVGLGG